MAQAGDADDMDAALDAAAQAAEPSGTLAIGLANNDNVGPAPRAVTQANHQIERDPALALAQSPEPVTTAASTAESTLPDPAPGQPLGSASARQREPAGPPPIKPAPPPGPGSLSLPPVPPPLLPHHAHHLSLASMPKMVFSDLYKSPKSPFSKLRHLHAGSSHQGQHSPQQSHLPEEVPNPVDDYGDPDLLSRDKARQKDAVRRFLAARIRSDWDFVWPPADCSPAAASAAAARAHAVRTQIVRTEQVCLYDQPETFSNPPPAPFAAPTTTSLVAVSAAVSAAVASSATTGDHIGDEDEDALESDAESVYSTVSEDAVHFRPREEWTSDVSDGDVHGNYYQRMPLYVHSPFRFDTPDSVGAANSLSPELRKAKARRDVRAETAWNDGLACFIARRDAWTAAHTVRVKPAKPPAPASPSTARRLFRFHSYSKSEPAPAIAVTASATATAVASNAPTARRDAQSAATTPTAPTQTTPAAATATAAGTAGGIAPATMPLSPVMSNSRHSQHSQRSQQSQLSQQSAGADTVATTPVTSDGGGVGGGGADDARLQQSASRASCPSPPAPLNPSQSRGSQRSQPHPEYAVETLVPVVPPLLPPSNPMRASITPAIYLSLYDKIVLNSLLPSCPINLSDMIRACVAGWKRDNEWPPRAVEIPPPTITAMTAALRRKRREERRGGPQKQTPNHGNAAASPTSPVSPGFGRRMSSFLGSGRPSITIDGTAPSAATAGGSDPASPVAGDDRDDSSGGGRGIRRSIQRVLGFGYMAHGGQTPPGNRNVHTRSISLAGPSAQPL